MRLLFTILAIVCLVLLGIFIFGGKSNKQPVVAARSLSSYSDTAAEVRLTIDGNINSNEKHREIVITVGKNNREIQIMSGYEGNVIKQQLYGNNVSSYSVFLTALEKLSFTKSRGDKGDVTGECPLGTRYTYELTNSDNDFDTWSTTCGSGSFGGRTSYVQKLFKDQIPNYQDLTRSLEFIQS